MRVQLVCGGFFRLGSERADSQTSDRLALNRYRHSGSIAVPVLLLVLGLTCIPRFQILPVVHCSGIGCRPACKVRYPRNCVVALLPVPSKSTLLQVSRVFVIPGAWSGPPNKAFVVDGAS